MAFGISSQKRRFLFIGMGILGLYVMLVLSYIAMIGPGRSGIIVQGISPAGREYCIVQTYKGLVEPYQVSFYIRDAAGIWRFNYLAHEDSVWTSATVTFGDGVAHVSRDGRLFRNISLPTNTVDLAEIQPGYRADCCPSNFTPQDILLFHNKKFKED